VNRKYIFLGAFVIITIGLLLWLAQGIGALGRKDGKRYEVTLDEAAGLVPDNAVKVAGVKVGIIESVEAVNDDAVLTLLLDPEIEIHEDAVAGVRAKSLLGEVPATAQRPRIPLLADGAGSPTSARPSGSTSPQRFEPIRQRDLIAALTRSRIDGSWPRPPARMVAAGRAREDHRPVEDAQPPRSARSPSRTKTAARPTENTARSQRPACQSHHRQRRSHLPTTAAGSRLFRRPTTRRATAPRQVGS
jgi:hypothetical protein